MTRPKYRVLFFVSVDWFFCSHFLQRAKAACEAGYEVTVLTHVDRHREQIEAAGLRLIPLAIDRRSVNPAAAICTLWRIFRIYRREKPTIVHHVALKPILLGSIAARFAAVPHIVNAVVGGGYAFTSNHPAMRAARPLLRLVLSALLDSPRSRVVFENADDMSVFVQSKQISEKRAVLIRGAGVEPERYREGGPLNENPIVLLAARLLWDKGIGEYVQAARLLRTRGVPSRFVIVGSTDPGNRACIDQETLAKWNAEGVVELWGFCENMPEILAQASIACLPSYREGLPKFLLEAMAASLPCVTTDVPGCREAVRHGYNGLLVPPQDPYSLADALGELLLNPGIRGQMGRYGRERVEQEFSTALVTSQTLSLYEEMLTQ